MAIPPEEDDLRIAPAKENEVPVVLRMIKAFAEYERLSHRVTATEAGLRQALFGPQPAAEVVIAYVGSEAVGFAVFFSTFSTFFGQCGLYLEVLFVEPQRRRHGVGRKLLAHVAGVAASRGCHSLNWSVLKWNEPAIQFYRSIGAEPVEDWEGFRLAGEALVRLAREAR
jgi:GNAT superfamily N-acetyltransferase